MGRINKKLLPLKLLLFFLYAAIGCLPAFLTIHMSHIGLNHDEITWINTVLPLTALGGPPFVGYLADRFGHYRLITIISMFLAGVFHTALLFVPERAPTYKPNLQMVCGPEGTSLVMDSCLDHCPLVHGTLEGNFRISRCRQECEMEHKSCRAIYMPSIDNPNASLSVDVSAEVSMEGISPPNICFHNNEMVECEDFEFTTYSQIRTKLEPVPLGERFSEFEECCEYPFSHFATDSRAFSNISCNSTQDCYVVCNVMEMTNGSWLLQEPVCSRDGSNPNLTFWLYFCVRAVADMFPAILISLFDAVVLTMLDQHGGDFGRQKMFGLFAIGTSAPLVGCLMDGRIGVYGRYVYAPVFYVFDVLLLLTAIITFLLPLKVEVQIKNMLRNLTELIRTSEFNVLVFIVIILGSLNGYLETFLYIYLAEELNASKLLLGLTITVGIFPSLPFLYKSDPIVSYCGHHYLLILAFVGYCVRFAGLSYLSNPLWVIPLEMLEIFTMNMMHVASVTLTYKLAPKTLVATAQGIVWISHFGIGRALGTIVGGYLIKVYGMIRVFQGASVFAAACATLYLVLYQILKYVKVNRPTKHADQEGKENGTLSNGNYMPLPVRDKNC